MDTGARIVKSNGPMDSQDGMTESSVPGFRWRRWIPLAIIVAGMLLVFAQGWHGLLSLEALAANERALNAFVRDNLAAALAVYAGVYVATVALSLPGALVLTLTGGFLFGWLVAGVLAVTAATAGAAVIFLIARTALGDLVAARAGPRLAALREGFRRDALSYLLCLRLMPVLPFWLVNLAPALLGVRLSTFLIATFFGIMPGTFTFAIVGSGLDSALAAQLRAYERCLARAGAEDACSFGLDPAALLTPGLLAAFVALGFLALVPVVTRKVMTRRGLPTEP